MTCQSTEACIRSKWRTVLKMLQVKVSEKSLAGLELFTEKTDAETETKGVLDNLRIPLNCKKYSHQ